MYNSFNGRDICPNTTKKVKRYKNITILNFKEIGHLFYVRKNLLQ